jgi:leucyl aminopeptidase
METVKCEDSLDIYIKAAVEGIKLSEYKFGKYFEEDKQIFETIFDFYNFDEEIDFDKLINEAQLLSEAVCIARDLVNEPANVITPVTLAEEVQKLGEKFKFEVEIFEEDKIQELNMEAFWSVAKGSAIPPRFIIMRYLNNPESEEKIGLVGKGLTYDSGGYSLKPSAGMFTMKADMGGSASVIGAMTAIAKAELKVNVVAVVAACENMLSGHSYRPGDVIGSMGGKTIEVENTDAEGRLTLIDAVHYTVHNEKVSKIVDVATLTGSAVAALGQNYSVLVSNSDEMVDELTKITCATGEKFWRMPHDPEFKEMLKSKIADMKNIGGRLAGSITAGLFIGEFVNDLPWVHVDIAGPAYTQKSNEYKPFGASGTPVRSLYYLVKNQF